MAVIIPVTQPCWRQAALGLAFDVFHKPPHDLKILAEHFRISRPFVLLPGKHHGRSAPLHGPVELVGEAFGRVTSRDSQYATRRLLHIANVPHDFLEPTAAVVAVLKARGKQVRDFQPAQLFAVWTIGQHVACIRTDRPINHAMRSIEQLARALKCADLGKRRADMDQFHGLDNWQTVRVGLTLRDSSRDLHKLHSNVKRNPLVDEGLAVSNQLTINEVMPEQPLCRAFVFSTFEPDSIACITTRHLEPHLSRTVLRKRVQPDSTFRLTDG